MSARFDVALDGMGGDRAPNVPVEAAIAAARRGLSIALVGDPTILEPLLRARGADYVVSEPGALDEKRRLVLFAAKDAIEDGEAPSFAVRRKRNASVRVAARLVGSGEAEALVSAGSSGAVMAAGLLEVGRIEGVERPAIAALLPTARDPVVLLDLGANVDPTAAQLAQFGLMGAAYADVALSRKRPRVAILANGTEATKGTPVTREAKELLARSTLDFVGYCEGRDLFTGDLDVVVTDGFTGNVVLKSVEGFALALFDVIEREVRKNVLWSASALVMKSLFSRLKKKVDYEEAGAAPLLGLARPCLVAHGASTPKALENAIAAAKNDRAERLPAAIRALLRENDDALRNPSASK
ncbi:MAG: phosphate acyltransferase PlsX [Deltaproteobacteria bacterium]|nr:phosphate acyltransferase PlsX [Deltaproteobacteria bacterium]